MRCVGVERRSCGSGAPASRRSCSQEGVSLPVSPRITATQCTRGPAKDGCTSRFRWTGLGGGTAGRSSTGQKNNLWTVCGQDGSERICETLHLSDALGLRRVRSAQRDLKEANPWSPRVPRAQSTTVSPAVKENTDSWSVTGGVLGGFGKQVERLMRLPDVPRKREGLVAGGLMALGGLAATIDPRRGLARRPWRPSWRKASARRRKSRTMMMTSWSRRAYTLPGGGLEKWARLELPIPIGGVAYRRTCYVRTRHAIGNMQVVYQWWTARPWVTRSALFATGDL